jgi:hypothetical protein
MVREHVRRPTVTILAFGAFRAERRQADRIAAGRQRLAVRDRAGGFPDHPAGVTRPFAENVGHSAR